MHDADRVAYLDAHFRAAKQAIDDGVDLRGYFVWSLIDNFEWSWGFDRRFGVVHVDFATQRRTIKDSGRWLAGVAAGERDQVAMIGMTDGPRMSAAAGGRRWPTSPPRRGVAVDRVAGRAQRHAGEPRARTSRPRSDRRDRCIPNLAARQLVTTRSDTVGLIVAEDQRRCSASRISAR